MTPTIIENIELKKDIARQVMEEIEKLESQLLKMKLEYSQFCIANGIMDLSHLKPDDVIELACKTFDMKRDQIIKTGRKTIIVQPRMVLIYFMHRIFNDLRMDENGNKLSGFLSLKDIGAIFDNKDHSTIIHCIRKVEASIQQPEWNKFLQWFYIRLRFALFDQVGIEIK